jgi:hypothetical protein
MAAGMGSDTIDQVQNLPSGIEVAGMGVCVFIEAFKLFPSVVVTRLHRHGIGRIRGGQLLVDMNAWLPLENWLAAFDNIARSLGPRALLEVGRRVQQFAMLPPHLTDIHAALAGINVAYHMNHRRNGIPMFDPSSGQLVGGIGDYGYAPVPGERRIISRCDTPYPCDFDRGVLLGFAERFEKHVRVEHDDAGPCRKRSQVSCTYTITW